MSDPAHTLRDLFPDAELDAAASAVRAGGITADSRAVRPGDVFAALAGAKTDGAKFAASAIGAGAIAILSEQPIEASVPVVLAQDARRALALAAARIHPRQPEFIAAVTGTSGKSSTVTFLRQIWAHAGYAAASLGTLGVTKPGGATYGSLTTPDPVSLHRTLDELASEGVTHLAMEASSHGLDQRRLDGVRLKAAGFTNLSRDHMDYHPTVEHYRDAKLRLFRDFFPAGGAAAICVDGTDSAHFLAAADEAKLRVLTIGRRGGEEIEIKGVARDGMGQTLRVGFGGSTREIRLPLAGDFQADNALLAAALAIETGVDPDVAFSALEALEGVPGRLELIGERNGASVFVDYAHKPDALAAVLSALRPFVKRRLIVVFGCGGDRDPGKRPLMGEIAARDADVVIVTDDNPRSEEPASIRAAIMAAAPGAREIGDRRAAIRAAVDEAGEGDVVVVAGKGHETGQIVGDRTLPFSDHEAVREALARTAGDGGEQS
ncbi:UDP-N-acetylmuramoyl-L-alanyl-D-glutamate--2,6-diaminopimelate ligase [Chelatococcus sambhunathii]|uniref:UDP-N-acetylmuramoyl-L-alanyl-D-glutamate--2,6-diaminopimelate ligase n=1 Tax=Chelatococcus sambhunathii TaxID=363953 RepID=A0ABU1DI06_9HYPH|nr:UDP-N-acetylmuramoyl-L-alanyl-D-glutamate--2,6-diaminopimelate ligase [Chelatococcus sambhunathii]MDR4307660.1 UDP-N-acetylmuramoyl-L-alanyl-D-glutamate--2,6-diaminopimelate ligase [Chelatococcus sambhunathii]